MISLNTKISLPILEEKQVELYVKREDLIHPLISGNKYRKLKYNLQQAVEEKKSVLVTFGGAYSNHILATAVAGKQVGLKTIGIIRGEELGIDLKKTLENNHTLLKSSEFGMRFEFVTRELYKKKEDPCFIQELQNQFPNSYILPEGGTNRLAIKGCEEILDSSDQVFSHIACAMGTGGTVTGIINSSLPTQEILVFPALKGDWFMDEILKWEPNKHNFSVISEFHFNGYAKMSQELITFVNSFKKETSIPLDPIYTGKMFFGLLNMIENDVFKRGSKILAIHTGGLQGIHGINKMLKQKNKTTLV